jgi:cellulose synthase/poly-beta-1,6-N-acetylglucosamine synthase-like glycosyltransferase
MLSKWAIVLLGIWLIATGLMPLFPINFHASSIILALLSIASGVLLILNGITTKFSRNIGMLLLSIWLIAEGLSSIVNFRFTAEATILALLALASGILLLLKR